MEKIKRIEWLDVLKGILILFVILSHSYPSVFYRYFFTPFFLTLFFFASGYTFSMKQSTKAFLQNKWKRLVIPFLFLGGIRVNINYVLNRDGDVKEYIINFLKQQNSQGDELWFVSCLITTSMLLYIIKKMATLKYKKYEKELILFLSFVILILGMLDIQIFKIKFLWQLELSAVMVFYMALGNYYKDVENNGILKNNKIIFISTVLYIIIIALAQNDVDIHLEKFQYPMVFFVTSILAIFPLIYVSQKLCKTRLKNIFIFWGQNTLFYYAFAGIVRIILYTALSKLSIQPDEYAIPICCTLLSAVLLAYPAKIVKKYLPWIVGC